MKVLNIGNKEMEHIVEGLELVEQRRRSACEVLRDMGFPQVELEAKEYELAHVRTTRTIIKDMRLQELCEVCLSYFWDRLKEEGIDNPDVEYVVDMIGVDEEELKLLFKEAGYEED